MSSLPSTENQFQTTRWSLIHELHAANRDDSRSHLNALCMRYWAPIHQAISRRGYDDGQARALTRAFFEHLQRDGLARAERYRRFRDFLQTEIENFLALAGEGVGAGELPLPPPDGGDLERNFALEVIALSMAQLRAETVDADRLAMFEALQRYLSTEAKPADIERQAAALGVRPLFVSMAIRRLRQRFRQLVDDELMQLVSDPAELAHERKALLSALAGAS